MFFWVIFGIILFFYCKSRIYTNSVDSYIVFKRLDFFSILKKIRHPFTPFKYNNYKRMTYGNNILWPLTDKICYANNNKGIPITIPNAKQLIEFNDIKIYEKHGVVIKIKFRSNFNCHDIDFFLENFFRFGGQPELENGFQNILEKIIINTIERNPFDTKNDISQFINILKEKKNLDNETETNNDKIRTIIWTYINSVIQVSDLSKLKIGSSNTHIVGVNGDFNCVINF